MAKQKEQKEQCHQAIEVVHLTSDDEEVVKTLSFARSCVNLNLIDCYVINQDGRMEIPILKSSFLCKMT